MNRNSRMAVFSAIALLLIGANPLALLANDVIKEKSNLKNPEDVQAIDISPDGKTIACGGRPQLCFWDVATGKQIAAPQVTKGGSTIQSVRYSPDGKLIAMAMLDGTVRLWDAAARNEVHTFKLASASNAAFSPDGKLLATGSLEKSIKIWNLADKKEIASLPSVDSAVTDLVFSSKGDFLAVATNPDEKCIRIYDTATWKLKAAIKGAAPRAQSISISPDGATIVAGFTPLEADTGHVVAWYDVATSKESARLPATDIIRATRFSPDGKYTLIVGNDHKLVVWSVVKKAVIATKDVQNTSVVWCIAISPDGKLAATGAGDKSAKLWDLALP